MNRTKRQYWRIDVNHWGTLYAIGTEHQAETWRGAKARWEQAVAKKRLATDKEIKEQKFDDLAQLLGDRRSSRRRPPHPERAPLSIADKKTWVKGVFLVSPTGAVSVGGRMLSVDFAKYNDRRVKLTLEVLD